MHQSNNFLFLFMANNQTENYKTRDIGEASALLLQKQDLLTIERQGSICWFIFKDKKKCEAISNKFFYGNLTGNILDYKEILDRLKNRIFANT